MKLSKNSQRIIDAAIRAAKDPKADLKYFQAQLEKHVLGLEKSIASSAAADYSNSVKAAKQRRAQKRALQEQADAHLVILSRNKSKGG